MNKFKNVSCKYKVGLILILLLVFSFVGKRHASEPSVGNYKWEFRILTFLFEPAVSSLPCVLQLLLMTDATDMLTVPAVQPTRTGASGVTTRNASQPAATVPRFVRKGGW